MINEKRTVIIKDVELFYTKLDQPANPFGTEQWETQIRTTDKGAADSWKKDFYLNVKENKEENYWFANLTRGLYRKDKGKVTDQKNSPPDVVNGQRQPMDPSTIGYGSKGAVRIFQAPYKFNGREGVSTTLSAVQVTELVPYEKNTSVDFDVVASTNSEGASQDF